MSFLLNNSAIVHSRIPATSGWNNFTPAKGCSIKFEGDGVIDQRLHMQGIRLPQPINMLNGLSASKDTPSVVFNPGLFLLVPGTPHDYPQATFTVM